MRGADVLQRADKAAVAVVHLSGNPRPALPEEGQQGVDHRHGGQAWGPLRFRRRAWLRSVVDVPCRASTMQQV